MKINTADGLQDVGRLFDFVIGSGSIIDTNGEDLGYSTGLTLILSDAQAAELISQLTKAIEHRQYKDIYIGLVGDMQQIKESDLPIADSIG